MDKRKIAYWFIGCMSLYAVIRLIRPELSNDWIFVKFYATDFIFVPAMCFFALFFIRLIRRDASVIPWWMVLVQTALISFYFEIYLPSNDVSLKGYVSDMFDIVFYFLGASVFIVIQHRSFRLQTRKG